MFDQVPRPEAHLSRWFLSSGSVNLLIAIGLLVLAAGGGGLGSSALILWPSAIAGIADPHTWGAKVLAGSIMFAGQFFLYGLAGLAIGYGVYLARLLLFSGR